jgi:AcrR family transcriptional regulator
MPGKRDSHERLPELIAAAVHVFTREGYPLATMSDVAAEMGLSEAAIHRYTGSKEDLFVPAIRQVGALVHALFPASAVAAGGR